MTEEKKKLLEKLKQDKEKLIEIKKKYGKEYEELKNNSLSSNKKNKKYI